MIPITTAALEPAALELADCAAASPPYPPHLGPVGDPTVTGETQDRATGGSGVKAENARDTGGTSSEVLARALPWSGNVLAVIVRPGRESADLGAMLYAFYRRGARLSLLCLTRGEASPVNSTCERLETVRPFELLVAAGLVGVSSVTVCDYPDGGLLLAPMAELTERVRRAIRSHAPDLLLVVDPAAAGDPDDARAAKAACLAAASAGRPVLARCLPGTRSRWVIELGADAAAVRAIQRCAARAHVSQSDVWPLVLRRLDLLGGRERLRWLIPPAPDSRAGEEPAATVPSPAAARLGNPTDNQHPHRGRATGLAVARKDLLPVAVPTPADRPLSAGRPPAGFP